MPAVLMCILFFLGAVVLYVAVDKRQQVKERKYSIFLLIVSSQITNTAQQFVVWEKLAIKWPASFRAVLHALSFLELNFDFLRLACLAHPSAVEKFALRVFLVFGLFAVLLMVHLLFSAVRHRGDIRRRTTSLLGSMGSLFMTFSVSIISTLVGPLQCERHPSGWTTMKQDSSVACWTTRFESQHAHLVTISILACTLPAAFVVLAIWVVWRLPARARAGDTSFLKTFDFLLFRFRPGCRSYALAYLLRSIAAAMVPAIPSPQLQTLAFVLIFGLSLGCSCHMKPWRSFDANVLDACVNSLDFADVLVRELVGHGRRGAARHRLLDVVRHIGGRLRRLRRQDLVAQV